MLLELSDQADPVGSPLGTSRDPWAAKVYLLGVPYLNDMEG